MRYIFILLVLALGCGKPDNKPNDVKPSSDEIAAKEAFYRAEAHKVRDAHGAILTDECDSAHFTALEGAVSDGVDLQAFIDASGKMHRRPVDDAECYPQFSGSESSKEMYGYAALYALKHKDLKFIQDRFDYGAAHQWVMGKGDVSRSLLTPTGRAELAQAIDALGGPKYPDRLMTLPRPKGLRGFEAFVQVVGVLFEGARFGGITDASRQVIDDHAGRNPRNAMFACMSARWGSGSLERAQALLLDTAIFPADRLPTSADYCERWITQREDDDKGWKPCPDEGKTHPAGAFLLAAAVCQGEI
jgi:hypothetical protein